MLPLTLHEVGEVAVAFTSMPQLRDGLGPYEMPPIPENVSGNASALFCRLNCVANVTLGFPLNVTLLTAQSSGITVSVELSLPFPELSSVYAKSPLTLMVPPLGQPPWYVIGMLHDSPLFVTVHPDDCESRARSTISPRDGRVVAVLVPVGVSPATIAEFSALKTSWEIACACACERLWLDPPQVTQRSESDVRAAIAHVTRKLALRSMGWPPAVGIQGTPWLGPCSEDAHCDAATAEIAASVARTLQSASVCSFFAISCNHNLHRARDINSRGT
jgi:hypothetical protein